MTGKFTQNVHNLGYAAGQSLHRFYLFATDKTSSACTISDFFHSLNLSEYNIPSLKSSLSSLSPNITNINLSSSTLLHSLLQTALTLPNRYRVWWLNLLHSDPLHVLVETLLIVMCIVLVVLQRRADWRFSQERKKGAPTTEEEEELINEWKSNKRKLLGGKEGRRREGRAIGVQPRIGNGDTVTESSSSSSGLIIDKIENGKLYLAKESKLGRSGNAYISQKKNKDIPESVLNFATLDYLSSSSSSMLRAVASNSLAHYGCGSCGPRGVSWDSGFSFLLFLLFIMQCNKNLPTPLALLLEVLRYNRCTFGS